METKWDEDVSLFCIKETYFVRMKNWTSSVTLEQLLARRLFRRAINQRCAVRYQHCSTELVLTLVGAFSLLTCRD
jgi:hypothetical protein